MSNECLDAVVAELEAVGIKPQVEHGGKHIKINWEVGGRKRQQVVAATASDWRARHNERSDTRRMLREDGLLGAEETLPVIGPRIMVKDGEPIASSLDIARHFDKVHRDVLRSIDKLLADATKTEDPYWGARNFAHSSYLTEQNKEVRCFEMTEEGFSVLVMGFTGAAALNWKIAYQNAFRAMRNELRRVATALPPAITARIDRIESDVAGLIEMLQTPREARRARSGTYLRPSVRRRLLRVAA